MSLAYESNTSLAFNTTLMRDKAAKYGSIAEDLRDMATKLDDLLTELKDTGWTTPAGTAFQKLVDANWKQNIEKYANLLDTLQQILEDAAGKYESLITDYVEKTKV